MPRAAARGTRLTFARFHDIRRASCAEYWEFFRASRSIGPLYTGLLTLQHRGQDSAGILTFDGRYHLKKGNGLVRDIFDEHNIQRLKGTVGLGHTRYPTVGEGSGEDAQPFWLNHPYGIAAVHNGNVVNFFELKKELFEKSHKIINSNCDVEVILNVFAEALEKSTPPGDHPGKRLQRHPPGVQAGEGRVFGGVPHRRQGHGRLSRSLRRAPAAVRHRPPADAPRLRLRLGERHPRPAGFFRHPRRPARLGHLHRPEPRRPRKKAAGRPFPALHLRVHLFRPPRFLPEQDQRLPGARRPGQEAGPRHPEKRPGRSTWSCRFPTRRGRRPSRSPAC